MNAFKALPGVGGAGRLAPSASGLFFAFWSWVGFEMAPNYGEESKDPKRNVPRALYISVIGLGIFYILTSWAPFAGYSTVHAAAQQAQTNAGRSTTSAPANAIAGHWVGSILSYLIITGSFACGMAFHNTTARYAYSLGREGLLPRQLGRTHPRWQEPAHRLDHPVRRSPPLIVLGFALFTGTNNPSQPGLPPALRADGGHGRDRHPVRAGAGLAQHLHLLRAAPRGGGALVEDQVAPAPGLHLPGASWCTCCSGTSSFLGSGYSYANWLGPIDLLVVAGRHRLRVLPEVRNREKYESAGRLINEGL